MDGMQRLQLVREALGQADLLDRLGTRRASWRSSASDRSETRRLADPKATKASSLTGTAAAGTARE